MSLKCPSPGARPHVPSGGSGSARRAPAGALRRGVGSRDPGWGHWTQGQHPDPGSRGPPTRKQVSLRRSAHALSGVGPSPASVWKGLQGPWSPGCLWQAAFLISSDNF